MNKKNLSNTYIWFNSNFKCCNLYSTRDKHEWNFVSYFCIHWHYLFCYKSA